MLHCRANYEKLIKTITSICKIETTYINLKIVISEMSSKVAKAAYQTVEHRTVSPLLVKLRTLLLGRACNNPLRFLDESADRPGPEANLPDGPSHKLYENYYYTRDGRREVGFPTILADATKAKALSSGEASDAGAAVAPRVKTKAPGAVFHYSE